MKRGIFFVLNLAILAAVVVANEAITEEENVLVLTTTNFDDAVKQNKYLLVEFCKYPMTHAGRQAGLASLTLSFDSGLISFDLN